MSKQCAAGVPGASNPGLTLGAVLGEAALAGRNKLTILADTSVAPLGAWLEQLLAESTGKSGKGIVPIHGESAAAPGAYDQDRMFVYLKQEGLLANAVSAVRAAGFPVVECLIPDSHAVGAEIYRWEFAVAIACSILGVNAFDQPNVEDSKTRTKTKLDQHIQVGRLAWPSAFAEQDGLKMYSNIGFRETSLDAVFQAFLGKAAPGAYIAINAFLPRTTSRDAELQELRSALRVRTRCATMLGYGPRFLHSTGQLQKGGPDDCLILQITAEHRSDVTIPPHEQTFGVLQHAQAIGDYEALVAGGRRVLWVHLQSAGRLGRLLEALK